MLSAKQEADMADKLNTDSKERVALDLMIVILGPNRSDLNEDASLALYAKCLKAVSSGAHSPS